MFARLCWPKTHMHFPATLHLMGGDGARRIIRLAVARIGRRKQMELRNEEKAPPCDELPTPTRSLITGRPHYFPISMSKFPSRLRLLRINLLHKHLKYVLT